MEFPRNHPVGDSVGIKPHMFRSPLAELSRDSSLRGDYTIRVLVLLNLGQFLVFGGRDAADENRVLSQETP